MQDWNFGKIPFYTLPPTGKEQKSHISAEIVKQWSAEFQLDDIQSVDVEQLPAAGEEHNFIQMETDTNAVEVDMEATLQEEAEAMEEESENDDDGETPELVTLGGADYQMPPTTKFRSGPKRSMVNVEAQQIITEEESLLNPQHGRLQKRQMKQQQKKARKQSQQSQQDVEGDALMDDGDDNYDFEEHFLPTL